MLVNSNSEPIALVCAADENYVMPLAVTLRSALANLKSKQKVNLFILDGGISQQSKSRIIKSLDLEEPEISWVKPNEALLKNVELTRHLTLAACYRLLIPQIVPKHLKKAIYLDSDMVVRGDLGQLWNIDMGDNCVLAVQDDNQWYISMAIGLKNYKELGLNPNDKYFNSGLLVIDLEKWRNEDVGQKTLKYLEENKAYARDLDQDGLNVVLAGKWGELDHRWNQMPRIYTYSSWQDSPYDEEFYNELLHNPYIIHFTKTPKPWQRDCENPNTALFFHYLDQTAWSGWRITLWRHGWIKAKKGTKKLWRFAKNARQVIETSRERVQLPQLAKHV
jgi:lipopolysaccharide biosynthesis glycosyltransferase